MNRQRTRDITFLQRCIACGYAAVGRQFGRTITYEGDLSDQGETCPVIQRNPVEECPHWRRAEIIQKPE